MANLQVGLQLMVVGMGLVFFILILLMYMMKAMSALILRTIPTPLPEPVTVNNKTNDEEDIAALIAIVSQIEKDKQ